MVSGGRMWPKAAGLRPSQCFSDVDSFFLDPVKADAVLICTPENAHFRPAMLALDHGYHVLLEKPIAQTLEECRAIAEKADTRGLSGRYMSCASLSSLFSKVQRTCG